MHSENWLKNLQIEDIPEGDIKLIAELCGLDTAVNLLENLPGITIFIPVTVIKKLKDTYISKTYDGTRYSIRRMALDLKVTERQIYKRIKILKLREKEEHNG